MPVQASLLDTDILSELLKHHPSVTQRAQSYLTAHNRFSFSAITRYEILRGLKAKQAVVQEKAFGAFCSANAILPITDAIIDCAAELYGDLYRRGELLPDADLLIAATALANRLTLVTNNVNHFRRITRLTVETWK